MQWHHFTSDPAKHEQWIKLTGKGRENFQPGKWTSVCSNHFIDAEPTTANPNRTFFLTISDQKKKKTTPLKRKKVECKLIMQDSKHTKLGVKENTLCEEKIFSPS